MKVLGIFNQVALECELDEGDMVAPFNFDNIAVMPLGIVEFEDIQLPEHADFEILVRKRAISLNYRDKAFMWLIFDQCNKVKNSLAYSGFGSDFVAEVVAVGRSVTKLKVGDRVIGNYAYPYAPDGCTPGVATNYASEELGIFHQGKVIAIPDNMPDEVAGAFTVGAQTSYSMVRRLEIQPNSKILITAGKSNTSIFTINAIRARCIAPEIHVLSTTKNSLEFFSKLGIETHCIHFLDKDDLAKSFDEAMINQPHFNYVIDPMADLYLDLVLPRMEMFGKYITCGIANQLGSKVELKSFTSQVIVDAMAKNISIIGNCIGSTEDLENALQDYQNQKLPVFVDSVYSGTNIHEFITRSFFTHDKIGKVVYKF